MSSEVDATRSQAPAICDPEATRSSPPSVEGDPARANVIAPGETFIDEPEQYAVEHAIGAGGMGTVLAAKSSRLGRPVALKIITADREDLRRRFEREARVTARLQHPAIVPVYGSGHRAGKPFYAMKHVTGEPLDQVIARTTTLTERIALLPKVISVTEAIAYAHKEHVIHRDLKPANILVGDFGETVVIDWGLAKDLGKPEEESESVSPYRTSADETAHGKVMGTPAYMPVEQARGEPVDERADVYALGAILYHVLAGVPAYRRRDEQAVPWETMLARVLVGAPDPLELAAPGVPPDLTAIVTRAMARDRDKRYASALELAEDLRRFQTGQLVGAHRYSTWQLVKRWLKRNKAPVIVASIAMLVLFVGGALMLAKIFREQEHTEEQRRAAVAGRGEAEDLMGFMLVDLRDKLEPLGKLDLLDAVAKKASAYYDKRGGDLSESELLKRAQALRNLGDVLKAQGHTVMALDQYRASLELAQALATKSPTDEARRSSVALSQEKVGDALFLRGDMAAALLAYRAALSIREQQAAAAWNAATAHDVEVGHMEVGDVRLQQGDTADANKQYRAQLAMAERVGSGTKPARRDLFLAHDRLGRVLTLRGDSKTGLEERRNALQLAEQSTTADPSDANARSDLASEHESLGKLLLEVGDTATAVTEYRAAVTIMEALATNDPTNAERQAAVALAHAKLGDALGWAGDASGWAEQYRVALSIDEALVVRDPGNAKLQSDLATLDDDYATALLQRGDTAGALERYRAGLAITSKLAGLDPTDAENQRSIATARSHVADALLQQGDKAAALADYRAALTLDQTLAANDPSSALRQRDVAYSKHKLAAALLSAGDLDAALATAREANAAFADLAKLEPESVTRQADLSASHQQVGMVLLARGDAAGALAEYKLELSLSEGIAANDPENMRQQTNLVRAHGDLGDAYAKTKDLSSALREYRIERDAAARMVEKDPTSADKVRDLAVAHGKIGDTLTALSDPAGATAEFKAIVGSLEKLAAMDPTNADRVEDLGGAYERVGGALAAQGDITGALEQFGKLQQVIEARERMEPDNSRWKLDLVETHDAFTGAYLQVDKEKARAEVRSAIDILKGVVARDPKNEAVRASLVAHETTLSNLR